MTARSTSALQEDRSKVMPDAMQDEQRLIGPLQAVRGGTGARRAAVTIPWALAGDTPDVCHRVKSQLPAPARLLYQTLWLPRYTRSTPPL